MPVAQVEQVSKVYKVGALETRALDGVDLSIDAGEFTALIGPSGSGKTTLLQLLGLLDQPTTGRVLINGANATQLNNNKRADLRRGSIGFIFQSFALIPTLTAYENVELPLMLNGTKGHDRRERANAMLEAVGLQDRGHHRPDQLSGGQQQRVAVARALAIRPNFILADEPTANLDTDNGHQIMEIMRRLNRETGTTFIFATHDPRVIRFATRVVTLQDGQIAQDARNQANSKAG